MSEVKKSKRTNQLKTKCLECNTVMDSDHRNKQNKRFHLNLLKNRKSIRWEVLNAPKNPFIISAQSQSVLTSSSGKTVRIEEPEIDSHVTAYSTQLTLSRYFMKHQPAPKMKSILSLRLK